MASQFELDKIYLEMCKSWSKLSRARRMKVGCLIVKGNQIISDGFNGMPSGFPNDCENYTPPKGEWVPRVDEMKSDFLELHPAKVGPTYPEVLHAEANAITKLAKSTQSSDGATLYCTLSPCLDCAKLIIQAGIKRIVFSQEYDTVPFQPIAEFLYKAGVKIDMILENPYE